MEPYSPPTSIITSLLSSLAILYLLILYYFPSVPSPTALLSEVLVFLLPTSLVLPRAQSQELRSLRERGMYAHARAVKKEAIRGLFGMGAATLFRKMPGAVLPTAGAGEVVRQRSASILSSLSLKDETSESDFPPGLGNWDNSCYQNCVLQGLSSLESLPVYLRTLQVTTDDKAVEKKDANTSSSLLEAINSLSSSKQNGSWMWPPAKLKKMSSWQQQDAQEYFSKICDELEKDATKAFKAASSTSEQFSVNAPGLHNVLDKCYPTTSSEDAIAKQTSSPLDGLLAQKVTCTRCGFSEGLSLIPFNCLTLPLTQATSGPDTNIKACLDAYTQEEEISGVECAKCTLVAAEKKLEAMLPRSPDFENVDESSIACDLPENQKVLLLPPELRAQAFQRLNKIQTALKEDAFSDASLDETCQIAKKARISSTKTRKAFIARPPKCLVLHVNRSVFDERTGALMKNYARVGFDRYLDLERWVGDDFGDANEALSENEVKKAMFVLKAVVTHYGRHENGHYICYRRHPRRQYKDEAELDVGKEGNPWYRLSDEDVTPVSEEAVLSQGGVFMLFYERLEGETKVAKDLPEATVTLEPGVVLSEPISSALDHETAAVNIETLESVDQIMATLATPNPSLKIEPATSSKPPSSVQRAPSPPNANEDLDPGSTDSKQETINLVPASPPKTSPSPPLRMRTARIPEQGSRKGLGPDTGMRAVAAS